MEADIELKDIYYNSNDDTGNHEVDNVKIGDVSVGQAIDRIGFGPFHIVLILFCGVVFMTEACEVVLLSLLMPVLRKEWSLNNFEEGLIGSCVFVGMLIGSTILGYCSDRFGRKLTIIISASITAIFGLLSSVCFNYWLFVVSRFIVGFSVGGSSVPYSLFVEFLPTRTRGRWLLLINFFWTLGTIYETGLGWLILSNNEFFNGIGWNFYVVISTFPLGFMFILIPLVPESLRFLALNGEEDQIKKILGRIKKFNDFFCRLFCFCCFKGKRNENLSSLKRKDKFDFSDPSSFKISLTVQKKKSSRITVLFKKSVIFVFINTCLLYMGGSFSYYGVTMSTPDYFSSEREKYIGSFISSFAEFFGVLFPVFFTGCVGRKKLMAFLFFVSGVGLVALSFPLENLYFRLVASLFLRGSALSAYCLVIIVAQESFPTNIRSLGCGLACSMGKVASATSPLISKVFPWNDHLVPKIIFYFVSFSACGLSLLHPFETQNRELEENTSESKKNIEVVHLNLNTIEKERTEDLDEKSNLGVIRRSSNGGLSITEETGEYGRQD